MEGEIQNARFLEGDRNIAFFNKAAKIREKQSNISFLRHGEETLTNKNAIEEHILHYFTYIFTSTDQYLPTDLPDKYIPNLVTGQDNEALTTLPLYEEIKHAVFLS